MRLDILAFGIHPDDVELSVGGTIAKQKSLGYKVGICDLTRGEMGSRGSGELRLIEADNAAKILNVDIRENLGMEDVWAIDSKENCLKIIQIIRKYQPKIVICNARNDRHPDHAKGYEMVKKASFLAGLIKIETELDGKPQAHYRPNSVYNYIQFTFQTPDFVVDISDYIDIKMKSISAYSSQFFNPEHKGEEVETFISDKSFLDVVKGKDFLMGKVIGVKYAEGFQVDRYVGVNDIMTLV